MISLIFISLEYIEDILLKDVMQVMKHVQFAYNIIYYVASSMCTYYLSEVADNVS